MGQMKRLLFDRLEELEPYHQDGYEEYVRQVLEDINESEIEGIENESENNRSQ